MLSIEINKSNTALIDEVVSEFPENDMLEINSYGSDTIIQILIPLTAIIATAISPVLVKVFTDKTVTVKYDDIEVSGEYKKVMKIIEDIEKRKEHKK